MKFYRREKLNINFKPFSATFLFIIIIMMSGLGSSVTNQNLISYYSFDDGSGTNVLNNVTTSGTNLTITNSDYSWVSGKLGGAVQINGVSGGVVRLNFTDLTDYQIGNQNFTLNYWFRADNTGAPSANPEWMCIYNGVNCSGGLNFIQNIGTSNRFRWGVNTFPTNYQNNQQWQMGTLIKNGTYCTVYLNGTLSFTEDCTSLGYGVFNPITHMAFGNQLGSSADNGIQGFDEVGFWMRELSSSDISDLWNGGAGINYSSIVDTAYMQLDAPSNGTTISDNGTYFNVSGDMSDVFNITNITYTVWNSSGLIHNQTSYGVPPTQTFDERLFIDDFSEGNYHWNAITCYNSTNGTTGCLTNPDNFTFTVAGFSILSQEYDLSTVEGSTNMFAVNVSVLSGLRISTIQLNYNSTYYDTILSEYDTDLYRASTSVNIPLVSANTNIPFYWNITLEDGTTSLTSPINQTVYNLVLDNCGSGTHVLFNFTMVDEDTQTKLVGSSDNTNMQIDLSLSRINGTQLDINFSGEYIQTNPASVCSNVDLASSKFRADSTVEYKSDNRFIEFYNIQNYTLTNSTDDQNITLYNLNSSSPSQEFKITYKNSNFNTVPGAIIQIQRKYIDEGVFKTVEIPQVGGQGYTIAHLVTNNIIYNLIILQEGRVLASFENIVASCQNPSLETCEININSFSSAISPNDFVNDGSFSSSLNYNSTSRIISSTFVISSGVPSYTSLNATVFNGYNNVSVCSDQLTSAGGTLQCLIPNSYGNQTVYVSLTSEGTTKRTAFIRLRDDPQNIFGKNLIIIAVFIMLSLIGLGISDNPMVMGIMILVGVASLMILNIANTISWIGSGATILWLVIAVVIILIKGANRQ